MTSKADVLQLVRNEPLFVLRDFVLITIHVFSVVTQCSPAVSCRHFEGACYSHLQGLAVQEESVALPLCEPPVSLLINLFCR